MPELKQKAQDAHISIIISLFPAEQELYFSDITGVGNKALPETWWVAHILNDGCSLRGELPDRINPCPLEAYQRAFCLLTSALEGTQFVDSNKNIGGIGISFFGQRLEQGHLNTFRQGVDGSQCGFCLLPVGTSMQISSYLVITLQHLLRLACIFLRNLRRNMFLFCHGVLSF